jgi:hypothetical protein
MQNGYFLCTNVSTSSKDHLTGKPTYVRSILRGRGDPGYLLTSSMLPSCPEPPPVSYSRTAPSDDFRVCPRARA